MVQGGATLVKYLLFFFNLIFVITGLALIIVGSLVQIQARKYFDFIDGDYASSAVLLIVVGVIIFFIAFFGCCGAVKENYCMMMTFAVLLFIIFIMELAGGIAAYAMKSKFPGWVEKGMAENFKDYNTSSEVKKTWDDMQKEFECCGVRNYSDYHSVEEVPPSCIMKNSTGIEFYPKGCSQTLIDKFMGSIYTIGGVGVGIAFIQLVGIVFACCLGRAIKKQYEVV